MNAQTEQRSFKIIKSLIYYNHKISWILYFDGTVEPHAWSRLLVEIPAKIVAKDRNTLQSIAAPGFVTIRSNYNCFIQKCASFQCQIHFKNIGFLLKNKSWPHLSSLGRYPRWVGTPEENFKIAFDFLQQKNMRLLSCYIFVPSFVFEIIGLFEYFHYFWAPFITVKGQGHDTHIWIKTLVYYSRR